MGVRQFDGEDFPPEKPLETYKIETIDAYGDDTSNARSTMPQAYIRHILEMKPLPYRLGEKDKFWSLYKNFLQWCAAHQVHVLVSFPSYLYFPEYEQAEQRRFFDGIASAPIKSSNC